MEQRVVYVLMAPYFSICYIMRFFWNNDKCRCECKELIVKVRCDNEFILNPSICDCECHR